ncbi:RNA polymerase factor sigma-54 [Clostridium sp. D53t1_180928_C8]|uniref:RNA polymerase factor sigma-54 n=1 Tax=Clostridium sp. D53t1_180928_C8 TaxID=2787101 RepID=UPI001FADC568|nr:RNA polymerase factor sigma-54 [Clostridium sp. D53t1_180928_C8]
MNFDLDISHQQKLIITQGMKQSINILQMSAQDLREYIDKEYEENPVIDIEYNKENDSLINENFNIYINQKNCYLSNSEEYNVFDFIKEKKTLRDYLYEQLVTIKCDNSTKKTVVYMINSLDDNGYLRESLESVCKGLMINEEEGQIALDILQSLEPAGIGARNLSECLIIQLRRKSMLDDRIKEIVLSYLEYVAENKYIHIGRKLGISQKKVQGYVRDIKSLEPRPSRGFYTGTEVKIIIPDAYIFKVYDTYEVLLNSSIIPQISINSLYKEFAIENRNKEEVKYIKDKIITANMLIKAIEKRDNTLLNLLKCIVEIQKEYFEKGNLYLKPMTLKSIASKMNIHESTVSRAIKEKYILTERGIVRIKDLFSKNILSKNTDDEEISINKIKSKIKNIIEKENKRKPLSDQAICTLLNTDNIYISRRTVAKYREELDIKSSSKRKIL